MAVSAFHEAFETVIGNEGGYVDDPRDPGGETKYGISKRSYPGLVIAEVTMAQAKEIYYRDFWLPLQGDDLPIDIAIETFDAAANHGVYQATKLLQRALGVPDDGIIGPVTLAAAAKCPPAKFIARFNAERLFFYTDLENWPHHGKGWARRVAASLKRA